ncbi:hypothetical protein [Streptomyces sp. PTY087I2]|uniref:hypothetical protein n=1 Tax=Streptomyces sp. PTY087I2 TaxID=1819298 RepID=UPI000D1A894D|nr:hypothetical protein [Streptomyces sp. PTY087I2]
MSAVVTLLATGLAVSPAVAAPTTAEAKARVGADWAKQSITFTAAPGQVNDLHVVPMDQGDGVRRIGFRDSVPLQPGDHCAYLEPGVETYVVCELPTDSARPDRIDVFLGDGDDEIATSDPGVATVSGGPGDDMLHGEAGDDVIVGGSGKDTVEGGPGRNITLP